MNNQGCTVHNGVVCPIYCTIVFHCRLQSLDKGGAITGRASINKQQKQPPPQRQRVDSPIPNSDASTTNSGGSTSLGKRILNSLNVGGAITGPPVSQSSNR